MSDQNSSGTETSAAHLHRLVLFSDAVFAIAITLLAIEIHPPHHWGDIADLFAQMSNKLIAYAVSFAVIGICWISHRRVYARLIKADGALDVLNFLVLGLVALLPLGTELLWEQHGKALIVYVSQVALIGVFMGVLWAYAAFVGRLTEPMPVAEKLFVLVRVALLPGFMCTLTFLSMAKPIFALLFIPLIARLSFLGRKIKTPEVAEEAAA
jgi:uncharacterized membrane protein